MYVCGASSLVDSRTEMIRRNVFGGRWRPESLGTGVGMVLAACLGFAVVCLGEIAVGWVVTLSSGWRIAWTVSPTLKSGFLGYGELAGLTW